MNANEIYVYDILKEYEKNIKESISSYKGYMIAVEYFLYFYCNTLKKNNLFELTLTDLVNLSPKFIEIYLKEEITNPYTRSRLYSQLKKFFDTLCDKNLLNYNPCLKVSVDKNTFWTNRDIKIMTDAQIRRMFYNVRTQTYSSGPSGQSWKERDFLILAFMVTLGMKNSEVRNIKCEDIDEENRVIRLNNRSVKYDDNISQYIEIYKNQRSLKLSKLCPFFFATYQQKQMGDGAIRSVVEKYTEDFDIKVSCELLRQTCINKVYQITGDLYATATHFCLNIENVKALVEPLPYDEPGVAKELDTICEKQTEKTNFCNFLSRKLAFSSVFDSIKNTKSGKNLEYVYELFLFDNVREETSPLLQLDDEACNILGSEMKNALSRDSVEFQRSISSFNGEEVFGWIIANIDLFFPQLSMEEFDEYMSEYTRLFYE